MCQQPPTDTSKADTGTPNETKRTTRRDEDQSAHDASSAASTASATEVDAWEIEWGARLFSIYHQQRADHFSKLHNFLMFVILVSGLAVVTSLLAPQISNWIALIPAFAGAVDMVYRPSDQKHEHLRAASEFGIVFVCAEEARLSGQGLPREVRPKFASIESECGITEITYMASNTIAHNRVCAHYGMLDHLLRVPWHHAILSNVFSFASTTYQRAKSKT